MRFTIRFSMAVIFLGSVALAQGQIERRSQPHNGGTLHFKNVTSLRITQLPEVAGPHHKGLAVGDFDQDGYPDVAMAVAAGTFGSRVNKLYRNDGGHFVEVTGAPIIPELALAEVSRVAEFRDFDGDGWLDLLLVSDSYEFNDPMRLFMNQHPGGVFSHFVEEGIARGLGYDWACGAIADDVDNDGDCDVSTANYGGLGQDSLYINDGTGQFTEVTTSHMPSETDFSVDQAIGDMNGDGKPDILVCNDGAATYIYYNDLRGQGDQGVGDYRYGPGGNDGLQPLGAATGHNSLEPADFNNDGWLDLYWSNAQNGHEDIVLRNHGADAQGFAQFTQVALPAALTSVSTNKVTIADIDGDGRLDALVMTDNRPVILRNVGVGGEIEFLDWTPGDSFPTDGTLGGTSAAILDSDQDGDLDLFVGASSDDHLFERVPGTDLRAAELVADALPAFMNQPALAIRGRLDAGAQRTFSAGALGATGSLAAILRDRKLATVTLPGGGPQFPASNYVLEILRDGIVQASSNRGAAGVEEALQLEITSGIWSIRITNSSSAAANYVLELLARRDGPENDLCENPIQIGEGLTPFANIGAQTDGPAHAACFDFGDDQIPSDVWFSYQATCTGLLTVSTCGLANYDTKLGVYSGLDCPVTDLTLLDCNEDTPGCEGYTSMVTVSVIAGQWYKVRVGGWLGAQGSGMLSVTCVP